MSRIVKLIRRAVLEKSFEDSAAVRSIEGVVNYCVNAIPEVTQYETPIGGGSINVQSIQAGEVYNIWIVINPPAGNITGLTIVFPLGTGVDAPIPRQELTITAEHNVTGLTLNGNGATIINTITSLGAGQSVKFKFLGGKWYKMF